MAVNVNPINTFLVASGGGDIGLRKSDIKTNRQVNLWMRDQDFRVIDWYLWKIHCGCYCQ
jgi:hypothetical protein